MCHHKQAGIDPRADLVAIKAEVDGRTIILHPADVEFVYDDTPPRVIWNDMGTRER